ncbi:MAG: response regulator [Candidatus Omnitrophica bacterium]|nr:response regulator [Candidatus Omnitrophota bacterium]
MLEEGRGKKILLIGGGEEDPQFILRACQSTGCEIQQVFDTEKALRGLLSFNSGIELIILDIDAPGMDGVEVLRTIRSTHPELPVIILTAFHERQIEYECLGIEALIRKPYSPESFINRVLFALERKCNKKQKPEPVPSGNPSAKVLIANEKREICELLCVVLTEDVLNSHFDVAWVCSGEDALRVSREFKPDIGILDVKMSDMWGHELIEQFKDGKGHSPKDFIIYSSFADQEKMDPILKLGYPVFLDLMQLEILVECLKRMCVQHRLVREA